MSDLSVQAPPSAEPHPPATRLSDWPMLRWFGAAAALSVPQAAAPVAFSLVALGAVGQARLGAALVLAMTLAQVLGAIPITRLGQRWSATAYLRALVLFRTAALMGIALGFGLGVPFGGLVVLAALAGLVNGATYGYLRALLNGLAGPEQMPRALGISATLNEVVFVLGPVLASGVGSLSPMGAVLLIALLGGAPAVLVPRGLPAPPPAPKGDRSPLLTRDIALWLTCSAAGGASVGAIEIGAVALALQYDRPPAHAILFTVPLCLASVTGGLWVSIRNRMSGRGLILGQLSILSAGMLLAALGGALWMTILGAVMIGLMLAPLATHYALVLDHLAPPHRRAEVFALLRTSNAVGVIVTSALLTVLPLHTAFLGVAVVMCITAVVVAMLGREVDPVTGRVRP